MHHPRTASGRVSRCPLVTEAFAPTNTLLGNPGALMRVSRDAR